MEPKLVLVDKGLQTQHLKLAQLLALCKELSESSARSKEAHYAAQDREHSLYDNESTLIERQAARATARQLSKAYHDIDERYDTARYEYFKALSDFNTAVAKALGLAPHGGLAARADFPWMDPCAKSATRRSHGSIR